MTDTTTKNRPIAALPFLAALLAALPCEGQATVQVQPPARPAQAAQPPVSVSEQRFRDLANYIGARGTIDEATRRDLIKLAADLDRDINAPTSSLEMVQRLCPARVVVATWIGDDDGIDASFAKLKSMAGDSDMIAMLWAQECIASARYEKAFELLKRQFAPDRAVDANITIAEANLGLLRFDEAQAALNTAPSLNRTTPQQQKINALSARINALRTMWLKEFAAMTKDAARDDNPIVEIVTSKGSIMLDLFEEEAPNTVANFIEHAEAGTYAGTRFHRKVRGFAVQGGDPATASGGSGGRSTGGWTVPDEIERPDRRAPIADRVILARQPMPGSSDAAPNSSGCQFMFLLSPSRRLPRLASSFPWPPRRAPCRRRAARARCSRSSCRVRRRSERATREVRRTTRRAPVGARRVCLASFHWPQ
ncbi:MAG: peptidylprolyl isomerase [Planctomycetaceae bacterium]|nr:peptidylprolyl isomerase [Planctomycetaceae bacterium]